MHACTHARAHTHTHTHTLFYSLIPSQETITAQVMLIMLLALHSCSMQWAYGVTCWEIFTAGKVPYATVNLNNLLTQLNNGYRLEKPANDACDDDM